MKKSKKFIIIFSLGFLAAPLLIKPGREVFENKEPIIVENELARAKDAKIKRAELQREELQKQRKNKQRQREAKKLEFKRKNNLIKAVKKIAKDPANITQHDIDKVLSEKYKITEDEVDFDQVNIEDFEKDKHQLEFLIELQKKQNKHDSSFAKKIPLFDSANSSEETKKEIIAARLSLFSIQEEEKKEIMAAKAETKARFKSTISTGKPLDKKHNNQTSKEQKWLESQKKQWEEEDKVAQEEKEKKEKERKEITRNAFHHGYSLSYDLDDDCDKSNGECIQKNYQVLGIVREAGMERSGESGTVKFKANNKIYNYEPNQKINKLRTNNSKDITQGFKHIPSNRPRIERSSGSRKLAKQKEEAVGLRVKSYYDINNKKSLQHNDVIDDQQKSAEKRASDNKLFVDRLTKKTVKRLKAKGGYSKKVIDQVDKETAQIKDAFEYPQDEDWAQARK